MTTFDKLFLNWMIFWYIVIIFSVNLILPKSNLKMKMTWMILVALGITVLLKDTWILYDQKKKFGFSN